MLHSVTYLLASSPRPERTTPLEGRRISLTELLGDRFDLEARALVFPTRCGLLPAPEAEAARREENAWSSSLEDGFARAFSDPPYGVRLPLPEVHELFHVVWDSLFGTWSSDDLRVMSWSTDDWDAFDSGREWWGSFLWTIARCDGSRFVSIAASTTD